MVMSSVLFFVNDQVTYLTTTDSMKELNDPFGFTFMPTPFTFNAARTKLVEYFNWKRAAIVYDFVDEGGLFVQVCLFDWFEARGEYAPSKEAGRFVVSSRDVNYEFWCHFS